MDVNVIGLIYKISVRPYVYKYYVYKNCCNFYVIFAHKFSTQDPPCVENSHAKGFINFYKNHHTSKYKKYMGRKYENYIVFSDI